MRKTLCFMRSLLSHLAWLRISMFRETSPVPYCMALLCYMIHYGTYNYRGAVVGLRGAVVGVRGAAVGVRGAAVGVRGAAVGNIGIPTYVISRGAVVRQPCLPLPGTCTCNVYPCLLVRRLVVTCLTKSIAQFNLIIWTMNLKISYGKIHPFM